jgi:hypothetical protein
VASVTTPTAKPVRHRPLDKDIVVLPLHGFRSVVTPTIHTKPSCIRFSNLEVNAAAGDASENIEVEPLNDWKGQGLIAPMMDESVADEAAEIMLDQVNVLYVELQQQEEEEEEDEEEEEEEEDADGVVDENGQPVLWADRAENEIIRNDFRQRRDKYLEPVPSHPLTIGAELWMIGGENGLYELQTCACSTRQKTVTMKT